MNRPTRPFLRGFALTKNPVLSPVQGEHEGRAKISGLAAWVTRSQLLAATVMFLQGLRSGVGFEAWTLAPGVLFFLLVGQMVARHAEAGEPGAARGLLVGCYATQPLGVLLSIYLHSDQVLRSSSTASLGILFQSVLWGVCGSVLILVCWAVGALRDRVAATRPRTRGRAA